MESGLAHAHIASGNLTLGNDSSRIPEASSVIPKNRRPHAMVDIREPRTGATESRSLSTTFPLRRSSPMSPAGVYAASPRGGSC